MSGQPTIQLIMSNQESDTLEPRFFELLTPEDKILYSKLKESLSGRGTRNRRGKRLEAFSDMLIKVKDYSIRGDEDDWKRSLVCGVVWLNDSIAINTRQLRSLVEKCKSSINGSLHRMGYNPTAASGDQSTILIEKLPILKGNFSELRQWTVRHQMSSTPQPISNFNQVQNIPPISPSPQLNTDNIIFDYSTFQNELQFKNEPQCDYFCDPFSLPLDGWVDQNENNFFDSFSSQL